jgi:hypothetical protein
LRGLFSFRPTDSSGTVLNFCLRGLPKFVIDVRRAREFKGSAGRRGMTPGNSSDMLQQMNFTVPEISRSPDGLRMIHGALKST